MLYRRAAQITVKLPDYTATSRVRARGPPRRSCMFKVHLTQGAASQSYDDALHVRCSFDVIYFKTVVTRHTGSAVPEIFFFISVSFHVYRNEKNV